MTALKKKNNLNIYQRFKTIHISAIFLLKKKYTINLNQKFGHYFGALKTLLIQILTFVMPSFQSY
jgi:hypothetical protein